MRDRIGVEVGGTFTDLVWARPDGSLQTGKTPSTPKAIHEAVLNVVREAGAPVASLDQFIHGSTVATNALLTRRGAQAGLITTAGFRDVVTLGRADRNHDIYNARFVHPAPPIPRSQVREVRERIDANGEILEPLDLELAWEQAAALIEEGAEGIAICFLHAYRNPAHEKQLAELIRQRAPQIAISASHEVSPEFREYERTITTALNAFVGPVVSRYVQKLDKGLRADDYDGVLHIMQSNGGTMPAASASANAVRMLLSGPAAGVRAAVWFAERNDIRDIITLDMGGTSTDVAIAPDLKPHVVPELKIDGLPVRTASIDMVTIGAGGGSIAGVDRGGFLAVGPESAGAHPGPACYGRGGEKPTVTDAQLVSGILRPERFFGGRMALHVDKAKAALAALGSSGGADAAADSVLRLVNAAMAGAARLVSTARGIDPRDFTLVAYGGGGPLHAAQVADELDISRVLVPWSPGLASAFGLLVADTMIDASISDPNPLSEASLNEERLAGLRETGRSAAKANGLASDDYQIEIGLDMRYAGQAFELTIWTAAEPADAETLRSLFEAEHRARYSYARPSLRVEIVGYRVRVSRRFDVALHPPLPRGGRAQPDEIVATIGGAQVATKFLDRDALPVNAALNGPAVIEEATSTTLVPPGWRVRCLATGDLLLERNT